MTHSTFSRWDGFSMVRLLPLAVALCVTTACAKRENAELEWARAALQRNPSLEIVATDAQAGVFTLRDKRDGTVVTVTLKELAAAPAPQLVQAALASPPIGAAPPAQAAQPTAPEAAQRSASPSDQESPSPSEPAALAESAPPTVAAKSYTIERADGQLRVSGPGISIVSAGVGSGGAQAAQAQPSAEPIICEGSRMLHFDSRNIYVDGDAIIARGGCELYVTNSRIAASGTGIVVQDAVVHIANSQIEGATASFNAESGAKIFVRGSTFHGVSRRDEHASVQDQGGNQWR